MPIDASIYGRVGQGVRSVADYDQQYAQLDAAKQAQQMGALQLLAGQRKMAAEDRSMADQEALRRVVGGFGADDNANVQSLFRAGRLNEAQAYQKSAADVAKDRADADYKKSQARENDDKIVGTALQRYRDALTTVQTPDDYVRHLKAQYDDPVIGPIVQKMGGDFMTAASRIPTDPAAFQEYVQRSAMGMDKFIANKTQIRGQDVSSATSIATNRATNERQAADAAAARAVQMRGQNMTDARSRESNSASMSKPFEVTGPDGLPLLVRQDKQGNITPVEGFGPKSGASKPLNDTQAKALLFGTRMQESDKVLNDLAKGGAEIPSLAKRVAESVPLVGGALAIGANAMSSPGQQQVEQAQRDFINAVLRRESGAVIADSEFANARKQYFPEVGDAKSTKEQKARNRKLAIEGLLAEVPEGRRASITPKAAAQPDGDIDALLKKYGGK